MEHPGLRITGEGIETQLVVLGKYTHSYYQVHSILIVMQAPGVEDILKEVERWGGCLWDCPFILNTLSQLSYSLCG